VGIARDSRWPFWWELEGLSVRIKIRRLIVRNTMTPLYGEIRWRHNGERKETIRGHEQRHTQGALLDVSQWMEAALLRLPGPGRPTRSGDMDADELERGVRRAIAALLQQGGRKRRVKLEDVAKFFADDEDLGKIMVEDHDSINAERLRGRLRYYKLSFTRLRQEEMRRLGLL
jgi:hypothetical protein